jgi:hypothetical protein
LTQGVRALIVRTERPRGRETYMKGCLQFFVAVILHPVAVVLAWINIAGRSDLKLIQKILWALVACVWGIGPILYVVVGGGTLW